MSNKFYNMTGPQPYTPNQSAQDNKYQLTGSDIERACPEFSVHRLKIIGKLSTDITRPSFKVMRDSTPPLEEPE